MGARQILHRYVPAHFDDPLGLALRLIRTRDPAALFAMAGAAAGVAAAPLDLLLEPLENRFVASAETSQQLLILVCGAPRSGTTVVYQTLVNHLPVAYFSNLTALFPRAPLTAERLFGRFAARSSSSYQSYYGRTAGLAGTNDALFLWDRWLGSDRAQPAQLLTAAQQRSMQDFFAAAGQVYGRPIVNKNNNLNATAHLVAEHLPQAHFICLTRGRRELAQSLYRARCDIHGTPDAPYGLAGSAARDGVQSVCQQVAYFERLAEQQRQRLGDERFWIMSYEEFCRDPGALVTRVAREVLGDAHVVREPLPPSFSSPRGKRVSDDVSALLDAELATLDRPSPAACG